LRLRFRKEGAEWRAWFDDGPGIALDYCDIRGGDTSSRTKLLSERCAEAQRSLDLEHGPVARAVYFDLGAEGARLFLTAHHFVSDGVSWRVLLEDLETLLADGALPPKTTSQKEWNTRLTEYVTSEAVASELGFWRAQTWPAASPLPG